MQVVRLLGHSRVHIVGHSMGGAVGLLMSQMGPKIESFISIEGNLVAADCGLVSRNIARQSPADFVHRGYDDLLRTLATPGRRDLAEWKSWLSDCDPASVHASALSLVELSDTGTLANRFRSIHVKSYVHGSDSDVSHLDDLLEGVTAHTIREAGHFPMVDKPEELYATVAMEIGGRSLMPGGSPSR
jgi:pimeloyl-ACP methyl ester carboxylesterase